MKSIFGFQSSFATLRTFVDMFAVHCSLLKMHFNFVVAPAITQEYGGDSRDVKQLFIRGKVL